MHLREIQLLNFKNYNEAVIELSSGVNCFTGLNGSGKTTVLDAVHYLSMCKSYFTASDVQNIKQGENFSVLIGEFIHRDTSDKIFCSIRKDQKKIFKRNNEEYEKLSDHIGLFPVIMIAPQDHNLITEGSEIRRRFIDSIISQIDHDYLHNLITYNRFIVQRNALLKQCAQSGNADYGLFEYFDFKIGESGNVIYQKRKLFFDEFKIEFNKIYKFLTSGNENPDLDYESHLRSGHLESQLKANFGKDLDTNFTTTGIHKDDVVFRLNEMPVKKFASQGQQKTFVTALKLAHYEFMRQKKNLKPIVLLDDIYDKLDDERVSKLMQLVSEDEFGQLIITDTNATRIKNIFENINVELKTFEVDSGRLI